MHVRRRLAARPRGAGPGYVAAGAEGAPTGAGPAGRGQPTVPGPRPGRARRDRRPAARIGHAEPRVSWTGFLIATRGSGGGAAPRGERPQGRQPDPLLRPRRHRRDRGTSLGGAAPSWTSSIVRDADRKSCAQISEILQRAKYGPGAAASAARPDPALVLRLPGPLRRGGHPGRRRPGRASRRRSGPRWASPRSGCSPAVGVGPSRSRR